jgi:spore cortex biosynthesis protein YabQ
VSLHNQVFTLWMMFIGGFALGAIFDIYRVVSGQLRFPRWMISAGDILYWMLATVLIFRMLYISNQGDVRVFVFIGLLAGLSVYFICISSIVIRCIKWLLDMIRKCIRMAIRLFRLLIVLPLIKIYQGFIIFLGFLLAVSIIIGKFMLQLLYPFVSFMKFMIKPIYSPFVKAPWIRRFSQGITRLFNRLFRR